MWRSRWLPRGWPSQRATYIGSQARCYTTPPELQVGEDSLHIPSLGSASFSFQWLRDSCRCSQCVHPSTSQKTFLTTHIPEFERPTAARFSKGRLYISWISGHASSYPLEFLSTHAKLYEGEADAVLNYGKDIQPVYWNKEDVEASEGLFTDYSELFIQSGLWNAIKQIRQFGLIFVRDVPISETSHESCELRTLASRFSHIRETFYGRVWDVKNVANSRNIAYTNLDLGLHMDLLYFQHPPQYQILHCLRNRVEGGTSIFVDSVKVAEDLRTSNPAYFEILARHKVPFHYINDGHHLHFSHPTIQPDSDGKQIKQIKHINFSPPFQAPLPLHTPKEFYDAIRAYHQALHKSENVYKYLLKEGDAVLFDNRRVLHARTSFRDIPGQQTTDGDTNRWLKGCYIEGDAMWDKGRVLSSTV